MPDILAFLQQLATEPAVQRTVWDVLISVGEVAAALAAVAGLVWWLLGPRVKAYVEGIVTKVTETHHSVTVNGGRNSPPTFRDEVGFVRADVARLARRVDAVGDRLDVHLTTAERTTEEGHREAVAMWEAIRAATEARPPDREG